MPTNTPRIALAALLATALAALSASHALAESRTLTLDAFTGARIDSDLSARFIVGGATQSISVEGRSAADLEDLRVEVVGGKLHAWVERDFWDFVAFRDRHLMLTVTVPALNRIEATAGADVVTDGMSGDIVIEGSSGASLRAENVSAGKVRVGASSGTDIFLGGSCVTLTLQMSSSAHVAGKSFDCTDADIEASSGASATISTTGYVNASASSGATVYLAGNPVRVDDETSSGGDVDRLY